MNKKNHPGGKKSYTTFLEERRQSIAQLRVAERLAEEQQSVETGITDDNLATQE